MQNIPGDGTEFKRRSGYNMDSAAGQSYREATNFGHSFPKP